MSNKKAFGCLPDISIFILLCLFGLFLAKVHGADWFRGIYQSSPGRGGSGGTNTVTITNGTGVIVTNTGTNYIITADFGTNATNVAYGNDARFSQTTTRGDINVRGDSADARLGISPVMGAQLISDGTDPLWLDPRYGSYAFEEFISTSSTSSETRWSPFCVQASFGSVGASAGETSHPGIMRLGTGTSTNGAAYLGTATSALPFVPGSGLIYWRSLVRIPTLSTNCGEAFAIKFGLAQTHYGTITDAVYLYYTDNNNSGKWEARIVKSSSQVTVDTGLTVNTDWYLLEVMLSADGASVDFGITPVGSSKTTVTYSTAANIPTANLMFMAGISKTSGTTVRYLDFDYCSLYLRFNTARQ